MKLNQIEAPIENRQVYGYKPDGNTVTLHRWKVFRVSDTMYMQEPRTDKYGQVYTHVCLFLPGVKYGLDMGSVGQWQLDQYTADDLIQRFGFPTQQDYIDNANSRIRENSWIKNSEVKFAEQFAPDLSKAMQDFHDAQVRERQERSARAKAEARAKEEAERAEQHRQIDCKLREAEETIRDGGRIVNANLYGKPLVSLLMDRHNITVPLRTKGWIYEKLASVTYNASGRPITLTYRRASKTQKGSAAVWDYLEQLAASIKACAAN